MLCYIISVVNGGNKNVGEKNGVSGKKEINGALVRNDMCDCRGSSGRDNIHREAAACRCGNGWYDLYGRGNTSTG